MSRSGQRRTIVLRRITLLAVLAFTLPGQAAWGEPWPGKPLRAIVPIAPGSLTDTVPRLVFEQLSHQLGQRIVVENRPGAGGTIGTALAAKADADGYTLLAPSSAHTIAPALHARLSYDPARDFAAVAALGTTPFVLVVPPASGMKTVNDLTAAAKAKPGALNFASPGIGTASHLSAQRFLLGADVRAVHVPFKGGVEAMNEVMAGRIDFFFVALGAGLPHIREGRLIALAVNGAARATPLPDVPTLREAGVNNAEYTTWFGLFVPAGTAGHIVDRLHRETGLALQTPQVRDRLATMGVEPIAMSVREFGAYVAAEIAVNAELARAAGLKRE